MPPSPPASSSSSAPPSRAILDSPFLTHAILDRLLANPSSAEERIKLLSAKIHLYANSDAALPTSTRNGAGNCTNVDTRHTAPGEAGPSRSTVSESKAVPSTLYGADGDGEVDRARIPEMCTRLQLARTLLDTPSVRLASGSDASGTRQSGGTPLVQAQAELEVVLGWTKGVMQGIKRRKRRRKDGSERGVPPDIKLAAESSWNDPTGDAGMQHAPDGDDVGLAAGVETAGDEVVIPEQAGADRPQPGSDDQSWVSEIRDIREEALELMVRVEEELGRAGRADQLRRQLFVERGQVTVG